MGITLYNANPGAMNANAPLTIMRRTEICTWNTAWVISRMQKGLKSLESKQHPFLKTSTSNREKQSWPSMLAFHITKETPVDSVCSLEEKIGQILRGIHGQPDGTLEVQGEELLNMLEISQENPPHTESIRKLPQHLRSEIFKYHNRNSAKVLGDWTKQDGQIYVLKEDL